ncbi:HAD family hydrolase [Homoserinibacter sp. YIM 151385]|uniref:HAD family hydrolase n=1 Tax=Homoserinibacter sp. YIM 151385 TaxID=2985506 RepID=UPI0022EFEFF4|nr:HAD family hydrolase [Homoserinibacter sp. YIM 151385]WBU36835.1 HAD family hydrolase [Homoserinibacter sp. YIM 151385]
MTGVTGIRVVMLDLDDTLFDHRGSVREGIAAHRLTLGDAALQADGAADFARWNALEEEHYHRYLAGELDFLGQRRERARGFVAPYGLDLSRDEDADAWFDGYLVEYERTWALHGDALRCLGALREAGMRIGLITNGELTFQMAKVRAIELEAHLEHVVASGEVGVAKPDPRIFHLACAVFGVEPHEACYVGDRLRTDAIGAADAGLTGVWIDRPGVAAPEDLAAAAEAGAHVIRTLDELPPLLGAAFSG